MRRVVLSLVLVAFAGCDDSSSKPDNFDDISGTWSGKCIFSPYDVYLKFELNETNASPDVFVGTVDGDLEWTDGNTYPTSSYSGAVVVSLRSDGGYDFELDMIEIESGNKTVLDLLVFPGVSYDGTSILEGSCFSGDWDAPITLIQEIATSPS